MKKLIFYLLLWLSFQSYIYSQSSGYIDSLGVFKWQYHRSVYKNTLEKNSAIVTLVFINGATHSAVSYRQELASSDIKWIEKDGGETYRDGYVETITVKLEPNEAVVWRYSLKNSSVEKGDSVYVEKSAILIMNEQFQVRKEKFMDQKVK